MLSCADEHADAADLPDFLQASEGNAPQGVLLRSKEFLQRFDLRILFQRGDPDDPVQPGKKKRCKLWFQESRYSLPLCVLT